MGLISRWLGRRRPEFAAPPCPDQARLLEAARRAQEAQRTLDQVEAQQPRIDAAAATADALRRQNHLGPSFWAWAETLGRDRA